MTYGQRGEGIKNNPESRNRSAAFSLRVQWSKKGGPLPRGGEGLAKRCCVPGPPRCLAGRSLQVEPGPRTGASPGAVGASRITSPSWPGRRGLPGARQTPPPAGRWRPRPGQAGNAWGSWPCGDSHVLQDCVRNAEGEGGNRLPVDVSRTPIGGHKRRWQLPDCNEAAQWVQANFQGVRLG